MVVVSAHTDYYIPGENRAEGNRLQENQAGRFILGDCFSLSIEPGAVFHFTTAKHYQYQNPRRDRAHSAKNGSRTSVLDIAVSDGGSL